MTGTPRYAQGWRRWLAQKCLEVDIKPEVIDFYQGRAPRTVLLNHYVNLQTFADRNYGMLTEKIKRVLMPPDSANG